MQDCGVELVNMNTARLAPNNLDSLPKWGRVKVCQAKQTTVQNSPTQAWTACCAIAGATTIEGLIVGSKRVQYSFNYQVSAPTCTDGGYRLWIRQLVQLSWTPVTWNHYSCTLFQALIGASLVFSFSKCISLSWHCRTLPSNPPTWFFCSSNVAKMHACHKLFAVGAVEHPHMQWITSTTIMWKRLRKPMQFCTSSASTHLTVWTQQSIWYNCQKLSLPQSFNP